VSEIIKCRVCGKPAEQAPAYGASSAASIHQAPRHVCWRCALAVLAEKREYIFTANFCEECNDCPNLKGRVQYEAEMSLLAPVMGGWIAKKLLAAYFRAGWLHRRKMRKAIAGYLKNADV